jgi:hypothetical protein
MRLMRHALLLSGTLVIISSTAVFSNTPPVEPTTTWECSQADGTSLYTNKEKAGCHAMVLKPLSVVPDLENMPTTPRTVATAPPYRGSSYPDRSFGTGWQNVPQWAQDWQASIAPAGSAQEEICTLFSEWIHLVQKTRGGFFFGTDPSYGSDLTGRNMHGPSYSFYDNARYIALYRIFGTGFVPVGCQ